MKKRAREAEVAEELLEDVDDADDIKSAVIQLILDSTASRTHTQDEARSRLVSELTELKIKALKKRAKASAVSQDLIDDTDDADDVKQAVIELIVSEELRSGSSSSNDKPHFSGGRDNSFATSSVVVSPAADSTKHVMLSYQ